MRHDEQHAALEPTELLQPSEAARASSAASIGRAKVSIVAGDDSLSSQERETLRTRLRAAAFVILFGFGIYLVRSYFDDRPMQGFHTLVVVILVGAIAVLVSRLDLSTRHLRWMELVIFGVPVLFFVPYHYACVLQEAGENDPVGTVAIYKNVVSYWFCLLVIYGLFVPNHWKRATIAVAPMAMLPVLVGVTSATFNPFVRQHLNVQQLTDSAMILCVGALCAAYGAEVISSLRQEAREAKQFGQYRLLERLGRGGMGEVYKAEHQLLKRPCAIKLIRPEHAGNPMALARFEREVRTTAKLTHWNTIDIYDYGRTDDGTFYYVMEFLPGLNLAQIIKREGKLPPARVIHLLSQICGALSEAHAAGLIHRDIKTSNIFVTQRGGIYDVAKLLDFGLVKISNNPEDTQLTQLGSVSGTPTFMSPEQASAESKPEPRSDIYSLGAVAYALLTGRPPFEGESSVQIMVSHLRDTPMSLRDLEHDIPEDLAHIVMRCLAKEPSDRYPTAQGLGEALRACRIDDTWDSRDAARWWKSLSVQDTPTSLHMRASPTQPPEPTLPMAGKPKP